MKCHYIKVKGVGKVLIPGCMAVAVSNDIADCTCGDILTEADFEQQRYKDVVDRMKREIAELRAENEILRKGYIKIDANEYSDNRPLHPERGAERSNYSAVSDQ